MSKELKAKWDKILKDEGLDLKKKDNRTIAFKNRERIRDFFLMLDCLMTHYPEMDAFEKKVLTMYSQGMHKKQIVKELRGPRRYAIDRVIKRYTGIVLAIQKMTEVTNTFPLYVKLESLEASEGMDGERPIQDKTAES